MQGKGNGEQSQLAASRKPSSARSQVRWGWQEEAHSTCTNAECHASMFPAWVRRFHALQTHIGGVSKYTYHQPAGQHEMSVEDW